MRNKYFVSAVFKGNHLNNINKFGPLPFFLPGQIVFAC
jgi:hypothetical protein